MPITAIVPTVLYVIFALPESATAESVNGFLLENNSNFRGGLMLINKRIDVISLTVLCLLVFSGRLSMEVLDDLLDSASCVELP